MVSKINVLNYPQFTFVKRSEQKIAKKKLFLTKNNFFYVEKIYFFAPPARRSSRRLKKIAQKAAPVGAKIQIFEIFKIMKMLKNDFNKITTWKSDQEEFYIMMFGISK